MRLYILLLLKFTSSQVLPSSFSLPLSFKVEYICAIKVCYYCVNLSVKVSNEESLERKKERKREKKKGKTKKTNFFFN
jgi:hypothetical protein